MAKERRPGHREEGCEVLLEHMGHAELVVSMCFLKKAEIPFEAIFAFPLLDFIFHAGDIG